MKALEVILYRFIILVLLLYSCQQSGFCQEAQSKIDKRSGMFIEINYGIIQSRILSEGVLSLSALKSMKQNSFLGSVEFGYFFSSYFGLSTGIGYTSYKTQLSLDSYENKFNTSDSEKENYELRISASNLKENQEIDFLNIPFYLNIRIPLSNKIGFFIQPGVNIAFPISKFFNESGVFTYKGYYPSDNVLLENIPAYGFPSNLSIENKGNLGLKKYLFNVVGGAGLDLTFHKVQIVFAVVGDKSLSELSQTSSPEAFQISAAPHQMRSMMEGCDKITSEYMGIKLSLRYYLK